VIGFRSQLLSHSSASNHGLVLPVAEILLAGS
jgi:hypothetical protein